MFRNYITIAIRNLRRYKKFTLINLSALTLGLVPVILLLLFVHYELSFDRYHKNSDRIFRVVKDYDGFFGNVKTPILPSPLAKTMVDNLPNVKSAIRLQKGYKRELKYGEKQYIEYNLIPADPGIFDIFSFELLKGDPKTALALPHSIIISEKMVEKYFGSSEPIGKILTLDGYLELKVTGVLKSIPKQSHFLVDFLVPADLISPISSEQIKKSGISDPNSWNLRSWFVYFLVNEETDIKELEKVFPQFLETYTPKRISDKTRYFFQPLKEIHLQSNLRTEFRQNGDLDTVYLYASLAFVILLIACISYVTLATLRASGRAREVGVRKVNGAKRSQLIFQFLCESTILTLFSAALALIISSLILPSFNSFVERKIELTFLEDSQFMLYLFIMLVIVSVSAGSYPAFVLSAFKPIKVLSGKFGSVKPSQFRMWMAVTQFSFSMLLIISALVIRDQLQFAQKKDLGYRKDHIVTINISDNQVRKNIVAIKNELVRDQNVIAVSSSVTIPGHGIYAYAHKKIKNKGNIVGMNFFQIGVDYEFANLFEMKIIEGRNFSHDFATDASEALIVNETAVKEAGWESALGKEIISPNGKVSGKVIGVVKDFHQSSLRSKIPPLYLYNSKESAHNTLSIKVSTENMEQTLAFIDDTINKIAPFNEFKYTFFDELFDAQYKDEQKLARLFNLFAMVAVAISWIGLFGLVSLTTDQRKKEIGIRKILGASPVRISAMFTKDVALWVSIACFIVWPVAWYGTNQWLQTFAYSVEQSWKLFIIASAFLFSIVVLTVGFQVLRIASANPVDSLRSE